MRADESRQLAATGTEGFDEILGGGLPRKRLYLIQGEPGTGKTTWALKFLLEGLRVGEPGLYVTLSETKEELIAVAHSHGWSLDNLSIYEVKGSEEHLQPDDEYTAFHPAEVELGNTVQALLSEVNRIKPKRVVIDSLSEMRLLARDPLRYRRQILGLKQFFVARDCTIVFLDDPVSEVGEHQFETLAHGVVMLERSAPEYGRARRRLQIAKLRGVNFQDGYHDFAIHTGGLVVYPRLIAGTADHPHLDGFVSSGLEPLDQLLGGGPPRGGSTLLIGSSGTGKTTLCLQYLLQAAKQGEHGAIFSFDERIPAMLERSAGIKLDLRPYVQRGLITAQQIDPAVFSPGEFIHRVRQAVEVRKARVVAIDSLNGYLNSMPGERFLSIQMHELLTYLGERGVATLIVLTQQGMVGPSIETPVDLSYLADSIVLLRYFEHAGRVRKSIAVVKTRFGQHQDSIRELRITSRGVEVGEQLKEFQGVLSGTPVYFGGQKMLGDAAAESAGRGAC